MFQISNVSQDGRNHSIKLRREAVLQLSSNQMLCPQDGTSLRSKELVGKVSENGASEIGSCQIQHGLLNILIVVSKLFSLVQHQLRVKPSLYYSYHSRPVRDLMLSYMINMTLKNYYTSLQHRTKQFLGEELFKGN